MTQKKNLPYYFVIIAMIGAAIYRILPHPPNVAPVTAMALVGGAYLGKKYLPFLIPLVVLFISDLILNNTILRSFYPDTEGFVIFSEYMIGVYGAFLLIVLLAKFTLNKITTLRVVGSSIIASLLFFLMTNGFTWYTSTFYPDTLAGLGACLSAGLPFLRNTLLGDLLFCGVMFGAIELGRAYLPARLDLTKA